MFVVVIETIYIIFENMVSAKELAQTAAYKKNITAQKNRGRRDLHIGILVHGALNDLIFRYSTTQVLGREKKVYMMGIDPTTSRMRIQRSMVVI